MECLQDPLTPNGDSLEQGLSALGLNRIELAGTVGHRGQKSWANKLVGNFSCDASAMAKGNSKAT